VGVVVVCNQPDMYRGIVFMGPGMVGQNFWDPYVAVG